MGSVFPLFWALLVVVILVKPAASITCNKETSNVENSLKQHLFCNGYDPTVRPAKSEFDMINITMVPYVHDFDYHAYGNTIYLHINYRMSWNDTSLQWNATDWSNITMLRPNNDEIWFPEFEHINSDYEGDPSHTCSNPHCVLLSKGSLICLPVCKTSAKCLPDYSNWPFNTVTCTMWFANRDKELIDEINFVIDKKFIATRGKAATANWCLTGFTSDKTVLNIPGAAGQTVWLWKFGLQHTPHTALATLYFPTFVLVMFNIFICWLHSLANEKVKIVLISLICHFHLLQNIVVFSSEVPGIVLFIIVSMVLTLLLFVITLTLRWLHDLHATPPAIIIRGMKCVTNNRMMDWFLQTEYLSLGHQPTAFTNYVELRDWPTIVKFIDRCLVVLYVFIYLLLFCIYVPLQHTQHVTNHPYALCSD